MQPTVKQDGCTESGGGVKRKLMRRIPTAHVVHNELLYCWS